jgi:hypothetical protein
MDNLRGNAGLPDLPITDLAERAKTATVIIKCLV